MEHFSPKSAHSTEMIYSYDTFVQDDDHDVETVLLYSFPSEYISLSPHKSNQQQHRTSNNDQQSPKNDTELSSSSSLQSIYISEQTLQRIDVHRCNSTMCPSCSPKQTSFDPIMNGHDSNPKSLHFCRVPSIHPNHIRRLPKRWWDTTDRNIHSYHNNLCFYNSFLAKYCCGMYDDLLQCTDIDHDTDYDRNNNSFISTSDQTWWTNNHGMNYNDTKLTVKKISSKPTNK